MDNFTNNTQQQSFPIGASCVYLGVWHGIIISPNTIRFCLFGRVVDAPVCMNDVMILPHHIEPRWYRTAVVGQFIG